MNIKIIAGILVLFIVIGVFLYFYIARENFLNSYCSREDNVYVTQPDWIEPRVKYNIKDWFVNTSDIYKQKELWYH